MILIRSTHKDTYELFYIGPNDNKHHGVRIIVRKDMKADNKEITRKKCVGNNQTKK